MNVAYCDFPEDVYYDVENDVWLKKVSDNEAIVGLTTVLSTIAGRLKTVHLKKDLEFARAAQSIATIESAKYFGTVRTPLEGRIIEFNLRVEEEPRLVNDSPYGDGWVAKIRTGEPISILLFAAVRDRHLFFGSEAASALEARIRELKVRCFKKLPDEELIAVGMECTATLANLNELLTSRPVGTVVHILSDDPVAEIEITRWSDETGHKIVETRKEGALRHFIVEKAHS